MANKALKDWSTVISALGKGIQIVIIRRRPLVTGEQGQFRIAHNEFLLYPTYNHPKEKIKEQYHALFEESISSRLSERVKMEYLARCEEIIEVDNPEKLRRLSDYYIWTAEHVERHFEGTINRKLYILILRVYKLPDPKIVEQLRGITWVTLPYIISPQDCTPVLSNEEFNRTKAEIKRILEISPSLTPQLEIACSPRVNINEEILMGIRVNGNPVEGVNVLVSGNSIGMTDINGEITHIFNEVGSFPITATKSDYTSTSVIIEVREESEHNILIKELDDLGRILEYKIGERHLGHFIFDVTWKKRLRRDPTHAFEVHIGGDIYKDIASLKEAYDRWGAMPFLISTEEELERAKEIISGAFHEIADKIVYIKKEDLRDFYSFKKKFKELEKKICF